MRKLLSAAAVLLCVTACASSPNASAWEKEFAADTRIDIDSLTDAERCALTDRDVSESVVTPGTETVFVDWKEAGVQLNVPWNPAWGTTKYKTAPWRSDGTEGAFGPLKEAGGPCDNLLISAFYAQKSTWSLIEWQKEPGFTNLRAYTIGNKKVLRLDGGMAGPGEAKSIVVEIPGGSLLLSGSEETDIRVFEKMIGTMHAVSVQNL